MVLFGDHVSQEKKIIVEIFFYYFIAKFLPVAYGVKKLQIGCVVEDDKVNNLE
jgi:translation elongation factor EF-1beta